MASFRSHIRSKELFESGNGDLRGSVQFNPGYDGELFNMDEKCTSSPESRGSYGETQLEIFHYWHGLLVLHLLATLMFVPSLLAWLQVWVMCSFYLRMLNLYCINLFLYET